MSEREMTYAEAIADALAIEMRLDPKVFVLGEDVGAFGGIFAATKGLYEEFGPERVRDTPISEAGFMGLAVGAAQMGMRPVPEVMFADFMTECFDSLANQANKSRFMCGGQFKKMPLVVRTTTGGWIRAAAQHSESLEGWFIQIPGLKVVMPATPADAKGLLTGALRDNNPVIVFEHKTLYGVKGMVPEGEYVIPLGKANICRSGTSVTVIATSAMVAKALSAANALAAEGIDVEVIDPRTVSPLDVETIAGSVKKTHRAVVVQEAAKMAGTNAAVIALIMEHAFNYLEAPVLQVARPNTFIPFSPMLEDIVLPNENKIIAAVKEVLAA